MGGTIVAGTYYLTAQTIYTTADGGADTQDRDRRETVVVSAVTATSFTLNQADISGTHLERSYGTVTVSGTTVSFTPTCPAPGDGGDRGGTAGYTATPSSFTIIEQNGPDTVRVQVFTRSAG
jgi:hypothetical protein